MNLVYSVIAGIICYVVGALIINQFCVALLNIPLLDQHAFTIRKILCIIWLIISIIVVILMCVFGEFGTN